MSLNDTTYGWDVSNYQAALTEQHFRNAKDEGVDFSIALATDGTGFQNFMFSRQLDWGRKVGMLTASYHYVRDASISEQIGNIKRTVPLDCPVIPDAEHGSGGIGVLDNVISALLNEGYRVPLEYLPRWYWQIIGSPWLGGRPRPLWASWYPDYVRRNKEAGASLLPGSVWSGYGGQTVAITQFTSSGAAGSYPDPLDLNKFRGTRDELAMLLNGEEGDVVTANDVLYNLPILGPTGSTGFNLNTMTFWTNHYANMIPAIATALDSQSAVLAKIAESDDKIELSDEQLSALNTSITDKVTETLGNVEEQIEEHLDQFSEALAAKLGNNKETVKAALREFYFAASTEEGGQA